MRARVTAQLLDGSTQSTEGPLAPLNDRVAFERRFNLSAAVLARLGESFDANGRLKDEADPSAIKEEWVAFLCWRMLARGPARGIDFETWIDQLEGLDLDVEDEDEAVPPTSTVRALPTS